MTITRALDGAIVVGVDGTAGSRTALDWAIAEAQRLRLPLHLAYTASRSSWPRSGYGDHQVPLHHHLATAVQQVIETAPGVAVSWAQNVTMPVADLLEASKIAELIVLGSRGTQGAVLGSVSIEVSAQAQCPVVVVRETTASAQGGPVVVGLDGARHNDAAVEYAFRQASQRGVPLIAVHAWDLDAGARLYGHAMWGVGQPEENERRHSMVSRALSAPTDTYPDVQVNQRILRCDAVQALVRHSNGASLVVVGTHSRQEANEGLLGLVSQEVMRRAQCPVAVIRERPAQVRRSAATGAPAGPRTVTRS
ncbi:universal stress protein [Leekyejoonella antrihumi]|uniref:Universal stress protein n=1 Tax=Leekyejoonella antrihumi TaxID=1660198 RepID=A0A563E0U3_9MICO|nr:universal stress protein [Leekyejoonella antrihumi]TWP35821.1 universal stress protein [Leekyejoonella antrihumi]